MVARWCLVLPLALALLAGVARAGESAAAKQASPPKVEDDEYELQRMLVDTLDQVERNYVKGISRRELVEAAIEGVLRKLDPYSTYIAPQELDRFRGSLESQFGGIGIQVASDARGLVVFSPLAGTPAHRAGILAGDRIVEIDGKPTEGVDLTQITGWLKGNVGSQVVLSVIHPGRTEAEKITITREQIQVETVQGYRRRANDAWDFMLDAQKRIGYVRVTAFSRGTPDELRKAVKSLEKENIAGVILDLRFNPGGLLSSAIEVSDLFIEKGRIVSTSGRNVPERVWNARAEGTSSDFRMVVLVNRYTASASEIVSACLQDHERAVIMGERTWGKGSVQNVIPLEHGHSALKLTTASYHRPSGKNINRFPGATEQDDWGVKPDEGHAVAISAKEMVALLVSRRQQDVLKPKHADAAESSRPDIGPETAPSGKQERSRTERSAKSRDGAVTDRVLQKAVEYLSTELVKAD